MGILSARRADPVDGCGVAALFAPIASLEGVGPATAKRLEAACGGPRVIDLLFHMPERYATRRAVDSPADAPPDVEVVLSALVTEPPIERRARDGSRYVDVQCDVSGARLTIRIKNGYVNTVRREYPVGSIRLVSGRLRPTSGESLLLFNPTVARVAEGLAPIEPVWPLVDKLKRSHVAVAMVAALAKLPALPEWHDLPLLRREEFPTFADALRAVQAPIGAPPPPAARKRLAYDEALAGQVALALVRARVRQTPGRALVGDGAKRAAALAAFGHAMTPGQAAALAEIDADLAAPRRMLRLLQGDVGSGKTLVAALAMLRAVEAGAQAAIMAPTELLARQHARTLGKLCTPAGVRVELLAGSVKGTARKRVLGGLASGAVHIAVGTHALFQEGVVFRDLALAVVDEQHRFGVAQRLLLASKGDAVDLLVMTATPIPRTLLLTQWGEMAVSRLEGRPAGRQPIATRLIARERRAELLERLHAALAAGQRAYWITRAIEDGASDDAAAEATFAELREVFGDRVRLAHGGQDISTREAALGDFAAGRATLLVATTVVEVGVDVPEATIMVIEQAERFGLAALHQLRGRVGRGTKPSFCLLFHGETRSATEAERLQILRNTDDGFVIAEEDLRLRGGGDALGTRQAGGEVFRLGLPDAEAQGGLIAMAARDAAVLLQRDPELRSPRGVAVGALLRLFDRAEAQARLGAG